MTPGNAQRAITGHILSFGLDFFRAGADLLGDYDLGLVFMLVACANVEPHAARAGVVSSVDFDLPDELRRPVPANSVAFELGSPRETVRRQVNTLITRGLLVRTGRRGVYVPARVAAGSASRDAQMTILRAFSRLARRAIEAGMPWPQDERQSLHAPRQPTYAVMRHVNAFALRLAHASLTFTDRLEQAVALYAVAEFNDHALLSDPALLRYYAALGEAPPEDIRHPASTQALFERTGIPASTLLRLVRGLVDAGLLERRTGGVVAPWSALETGAMKAGLDAATTYLASTANKLAAEGVRGQDLIRWGDSFDTARPPDILTGPAPEGLRAARHA